MKEFDAGYTVAMKCSFCDDTNTQKYKFNGVEINFCEKHWNTPLKILGVNYK